MNTLLGRPVPLALLSALLLILAQPPFRLLLLPFTALVPLGLALGAGDGEGDGGAGPRAAWVGAVFGVAYWGVLLIWVPLVVGPRFPWAYPGYLVQVGLLAGLSALMAWSARGLHRRAGLPLFLALPLAWVAMEFLKAHFPLGLAFPWLGLGITLTSWPDLLGMAEWTGEAGVAFWLALVNGLLATALLGFQRGRGTGGRGASPTGTLLLALGAALLPASLGVARARSLPLIPGPRVAVVGTAVGAALRLQPVEGSREALAQVAENLRGLPPGAADLVLLPEATLSLPMEETGPLGFQTTLSALARMLEAPLLVGSLGRGPEGDSGRDSGPDPGPEDGLPTNSAYLFAPDGSIQDAYSKVRLVPGMEWGKYRRGEAGRILRWKGLRLGPLICYESIFGGLARRQRRAGATLLVNLTSDVWFGGGGVGRLFLRQHPAHLVMRAVENRMGVARAANGGFSLILDPGGRPLTPALAPGSPGLLLATLPVMEGGTVFSATGDLVGPLALAALLILLVLGPPLELGLTLFYISRSERAPGARYSFRTRRGT